MATPADPAPKPTRHAPTVPSDLVTKTDISELRVLKKPSAGVRMVMEAICIILGAGWRKLIAMGDQKVLAQIQNFEAIQFTDKKLARLRAYIADPAFAADRIGKSAGCAKGLCVWCHRMWEIGLPQGSGAVAAIEPEPPADDDLTLELGAEAGGTPPFEVWFQSARSGEPGPGGECAIRCRCQSRRAQRCIRSQLFPSAFRVRSAPNGIHPGAKASPSDFSFCEPIFGSHHRPP
jgi:hypothetical protein